MKNIIKRLSINFLQKKIDRIIVEKSKKEYDVYARKMAILENIEETMRNIEEMISITKNSLKILTEFEEKTIQSFTTILKEEKYLLDFLKECPVIKEQKSCPHSNV